VKVWDVFTYWREEWAARARLRLWADVDGYTAVALVGDRTHRGHPLPAPQLPEGVGVVAVTLDAAGNWERERQQRDAVRVLPMAPDDLVLLCDADELVDPAALPAILHATESGPVKLRMALYVAGTRWRHRDPWRHPAGCRARDLPERPSEQLRLNFALPKVHQAGWHLTYMGTDEDVDAKLSAFAHEECDTAQYREDVARLRDSGEGWIDDPLAGPLADILVAA
jgi:hypothetical protein